MHALGWIKRKPSIYQQPKFETLCHRLGSWQFYCYLWLKKYPTSCNSVWISGQSNLRHAPKERIDFSSTFSVLNGWTDWNWSLNKVETCWYLPGTPANVWKYYMKSPNTVSSVIVSPKLKSGTTEFIAAVNVNLTGNRRVMVN